MALRKFREIQIAEYRGVHELKLTLGEKGILVTGTNGVGKTSVVSAVRTLVQGGDVKGDAVRNGAEKAVLVGFTDHERIRRSITARSSAVEITTADGAKLAKPQERLDERAGKLLDPLAVISAKDPREAKKLVLETLDARTDLAALRAFAPSLPDHFDASGHAMEARARAERLIYDLRTAANAAAERAEGEAARADEVARAAAVGLPPTWPTPATAGQDLDRARAGLAALQGAADAASAAAARTRGATARVAELRAGAKARMERARTSAPSEDVIEHATKASEAADAAHGLAVERLEEARKALRAAEEAEEAAERASIDAGERLRELTAAAGECRRSVEEAADLERQAAELEATIGATTSGPAPEELDEARTRVRAAERALSDSQAATRAFTLREQATKLQAEAKERRARAQALDGEVKALRERAPAALMGAGGLEGVDLSGDEVALVGAEGPIRLSKCCGFERLSFAVELARRVNADARLILVDGLEQVAEDELDTFIEAATADGWALVASRVTSGPLYIVELDRGPASEQLEARRAALRKTTTTKA